MFMLASYNSGSFRLELTEAFSFGQYSSPSITAVSACWLKLRLNVMHFTNAKCAECPPFRLLFTGSSYINIRCPTAQLRRAIKKCVTYFRL